jgi:DNA gyrase/topoisomerase IV subunit A
MTKKSSEYILDISRDYSLYVCSSRAIPSIADGLKDAQRKAMWLLRNKNEKIKTISLSGELISSNLYLHGDASASGAISLLAAP